MGEPPRLPAIPLPWEKSVIYFVTMCVKDRRNVLANSQVFDAIKAAIAQLQKWHVLAGVVMPNHAHWVVSPVKDRDLSVGDFSHGFKRALRKRSARNCGNGSEAVLIGSCAPMRIFSVNGFM